MTYKNMVNCNDLKFILPRSTAQFQDKYLPGTVQPSSKVISHELYYNTHYFRFRPSKLCQMQLSESLVQIIQ